MIPQDQGGAGYTAFAGFKSIGRRRPRYIGNFVDRAQLLKACRDTNHEVSARVHERESPPAYGLTVNCIVLEACPG
jgi:hypothetical protein